MRCVWAPRSDRAHRMAGRGRHLCSCCVLTHPRSTSLLSAAPACAVHACLQLAELLPGRDAASCETLYAQYQTFLSLPYSSGLQAAFVAMVNDVYKNKQDEETTKQVRLVLTVRQGQAASVGCGPVLPTCVVHVRVVGVWSRRHLCVPSVVVHMTETKPVSILAWRAHIMRVLHTICCHAILLQDAPSTSGDQQAAAATGATATAADGAAAGSGSPTQRPMIAVPMQPLGSGLHSPSKQLQSPAGRFASPRPKGMNGALAMTGGISTNGTNSQATSGGEGDEGGDSEDDDEDDDGDEDGKRGGGKGGSSRQAAGTPNRPQRIRKPKQYLGEEPETTPTRNRRGSLPTTPGSASRRPVSVCGGGGACCEGSRVVA